MMDLNPIGKHCALQSCNVLDFLPIQCTCLQWFCNLHISPSLHDCSFVQQHPLESSSSTRTRPECAFLGCKKPSLTISLIAVDLTQEVESRAAAPNGCPGCHLEFCVDHRHMESHSCTGLAIGKENVKHETARAILAQNFSGTSSQTPVVAPRQRSYPSNPQKLAQLQKVNLMKLRHKAVPGNPKDKTSVPPVDQRLHVMMRLDMADDKPTKEVALWFRKTTIAGKALDLVADHFGLSHTVSTLCLQQLSTESGRRELLNHLELTSQIDDGSTILLTCSRSDG